MYKINDYVVYKHDVCKINNIKKNEMNGILYYVMTPIDDETLTIDIPIENNYLRNIISKEDAEALINNILNIKPIENINDKNIDSVYKELLSECKHENLVKIIKTTYLRNENRLNNKKKISEKDNTFFNLAEKYLYNELSISLNKSVDEIKKYIFEKVSE